MLVGLAAALAKAKRADQLLPVIPIAIPELISVTLHEAERAGRTVVLAVTNDAPEGTFDLAQVLLDRHAQVSGTALYYYHHTHTHAVAEHVTDLAFDVAELSAPELRTLQHEVLLAARHTTMLVSERFPHANQLRLLAERQVQAFTLPVLVPPVEGAKASMIDVSHLKGLVGELPAPLFAGPAVFAEQHLRSLKQAGVVGYWLGYEELHGAYLAGLRTGLRDRSQRNLATLRGPALLASSQVLKRYLSL